MNPPKQKLLWAVAKFLLTAAVLVAFGLLARRYDYTLEAVVEYIRQFPLWKSALLFVFFYFTISTLPIPMRELLKLTGAIVFLWLGSTVLVWIAEMLAAIVGFWIARWAGKDLLDRLLGDRLAAINEKLHGASWFSIMMLRIFPMTPYRYFNFASGLIDMRFSAYLGGSIPGILVRTAFFQGLFVLVGDELIEYGITIFEMFAFSLVFVMLALPLFWLYSKLKKKRESAISYE